MNGSKNAEILQAIVHKVGNPTRGEQLTLSKNSLSLNDTIVRELLAHYFLHSFNENEHFHFVHASHLAMNEVYNYVRTIFADQKKFVEQSVLLANFLYNNSTHAKVKEGEFYVVHFNDVLFNDESVEAIGLFKSESMFAPH